MDFTLYLGRFADPILTTDPAQRVRLAMCLNSAIYYVIYATLLVVQIPLGFADPVLTWPLVAAELIAPVGYYAFIRAGYNQRFTGDPSLLRVQIGTGSVFTLWAFAALGPGATAVLMCIATQVVYAMFALQPRQVNWFIALTLLGLGLTMAVCHALQPGRYPADVQIMSFLYACLVVPLIGSLATRVTSMSEKLRANSRALKEALATVQDLATRDDLTRTYNRRHMTELMLLEQKQHQRSGAPLCIALLDIDLFKAVNDRHGHQAGDEVLKRFAQAARDELRASDLLARWGGEEFMVLLPDTDVAAAQQAVQRLQDQLAAMSFDDIATGLTVSFSGGITLLGPDELLDTAVERADQAMYRAKTQGRGRSLVELAAIEPAASAVGALEATTGA
jgi:diguanylate cyclase (GGDEF)-like protein